jgi:hypothetical protein
MQYVSRSVMKLCHMSRICGSGPRESQSSTAIQNGQMGLQDVEQVHRSRVCEHPRPWVRTVYPPVKYVYDSMNCSLHIPSSGARCALHRHKRMRESEPFAVETQQRPRNGNWRQHRKRWYKVRHHTCCILASRDISTERYWSVERATRVNGRGLQPAPIRVA